MIPERLPAFLRKREVLVSLFLIGLVGGGLSMSTHALWTDEDRSESNVVRAGSLDLTLDGGEPVSAVLALDNATPGETTAHQFVLANDGTVAAGTVTVTVSYTESDPPIEIADPDLDVPLNASETASLTRVHDLTYTTSAGDVVDLRGSVNDTNGNGIVDLQDLERQGDVMADLPAPDSSGGTTFEIELGLASDDASAFVVGGNTAGNLTGEDEDLMGEGIDVTITFTMDQAT